MPRAPQQEIVKATGPNGLVAAAVRLTGRSGKPDKKPKRPPAWYSRAWEFYDEIGEYRYAVTWVGNLLSRATLEVWENGQKTENSDALEAGAALFGGEEGQREMLRQLGTHLTVPGEAYIVGEDMGESPDEWAVVSATRISRLGGTWKVGNSELDQPLVIRIWRPHPQKQSEADSPSRAVLPILAEIQALMKYKSAQISSRLTGAGVFAIPSEISFSSVRNMVKNEDGTDSESIDSGVDAFLMEFIEVISAATSDPEDPAARVPIILQGPGEFLDKMKHITFWSELDEKAKEMLDDDIRRLALGMDMPPEILTGTGEMNHWNSWQVEEASIKAHTEPLLQIITTSLSEAYLRPYLEAGGMSEEEARTFSFHADTSKIRLRPNRSKEAIELYEHGELSAEAMLRENGFDPADVMTEEERAKWLTKKVAGGSTTPELVAWALNILGVPIPMEAIMATEVEPTEARPDPSLLEHPVRAIPEVQDVQASAAVVHRALERAGARLKSKYKSALVPGGDTVANENVYRYAKIDDKMQDDLLVGAWECIDTLDLDLSPTQLDGYVRHLFRTNEPFSVNRLASWAARKD